MLIKSSSSLLGRLAEVFKETCEQMDVEFLEFGGEDDHVHMMLCVPPKLAISNLVSKLKGKVVLPASPRVLVAY